MEVIHRAYETEPVKQPAKKELEEARERAFVRRMQYRDFLKAGKNPEVMAIEAKAKKVDPDFRPKFMK